ncbi:unnamed protein product [Blepharisma stoltei]|uniref:Autophagy-related protein n=1 Tax=Blepharisma stoltei TaxID=1481888 RepID=A0AAU9K5P2_9CILI|nr:unnamed protein product [Blepharisma stoltei]
MSYNLIEVQEYIQHKSLEERMQKSSQMMNDNQGKIPAILLKAKSCTYKLPVQKLSIDGSMTMGSLLFALRKYMWLTPSQGLYVYINDTLPMLNSRLSDLYERYKEEDGFLYLLCAHQEDKGFYNTEIF